jgi:hypothetical protein
MKTGDRVKIIASKGFVGVRVADTGEVIEVRPGVGSEGDQVYHVRFSDKMTRGYAAAELKKT